MLSMPHQALLKIHLAWQAHSKKESILKCLWVEIIEQVTCTRSSQCSPITINGKEEKPFCSTSHQCTIKLEDKPLVEKQDVRELKPLNIPFWVYPVGAVSVALIIVGMLWYFGGKKRWMKNKRQHIKI